MMAAAPSAPLLTQSWNHGEQPAPASFSARCPPSGAAPDVPRRPEPLRAGPRHPHHPGAPALAVGRPAPHDGSTRPRVWPRRSSRAPRARPSPADGTTSYAASERTGAAPELALSGASAREACRASNPRGSEAGGGHRRCAQLPAPARARHARLAERRGAREAGAADGAARPGRRRRAGLPLAEGERPPHASCQRGMPLPYIRRPPRSA